MREESKCQGLGMFLELKKRSNDMIESSKIIFLTQPLANDRYFIEGAWIVAQKVMKWSQLLEESLD